MNQLATEFLTRCFEPEETIALLLRGDQAGAPVQRVIALEAVLAPRYLAWLAHQNRAGANIYIGANPLSPGSRRRTKEHIASVRHLYLDIDVEGDAKLAAIDSSGLVPTPTAVVSTSPGRYQVLWRVVGFDFVGQERMLKLLSITYGGDRACTDCNRMLRVPGFQNQKYDPAYPVTVRYMSESVRTPADFRLDSGILSDLPSPDRKPQRKQLSERTNSENDWAWASGQLARGMDAHKLTHELALRRSDKPNPLYYAQRTVDVASARLWLNDGIRMDDVITMLEVRRRFEIPAALCAPRAREIAATAKRMLVHKRTV